MFFISLTSRARRVSCVVEVVEPRMINSEEFSRWLF